MISEVVGLEPIVDERLIELGYGEWEGKTLAEEEKNDPETFRAWDVDPGQVAPPGGESGLEAQQRVVPFLDFLAARHRQRHVAVVLHKTVCRLAVCHFLGMSPSDYRRRLTMENAALNIVLPHEDGWQLVTFNDTSHLSVYLPPRASGRAESSNRMANKFSHSSRLMKSSIFNEDGVDFARAVDAADEDLFDIGSAAGPCNEDNGTSRDSLVRIARDGKPFQDFIQRRYQLAPPVQSNVDRRGQRCQLGAFRQTGHDQAAGFRQREFHTCDPDCRSKAGFGKDPRGSIPGSGEFRRRGLPNGDVLTPRAEQRLHVKLRQKWIAGKDHACGFGLESMACRISPNACRSAARWGMPATLVNSASNLGSNSS